MAATVQIHACHRHTLSVRSCRHPYARAAVVRLQLRMLSTVLYETLIPDDLLMHASFGRLCRPRRAGAVVATQRCWAVRPDLIEQTILFPGVNLKYLLLKSQRARPTLQHMHVQPQVAVMCRRHGTRCGRTLSSKAR